MLAHHDRTVLREAPATQSVNKLLRYLYEVCPSTIDFIIEKSPYGAAASDGRSKMGTTGKFEETSRISKES